MQFSDRRNQARLPNHESTAPGPNTTPRRVFLTVVYFEVNLKQALKRFAPFLATLASSIVVYTAICPQLRWKYGVFLAPAIWAALALRKHERPARTVETSAKKRGFLRRTAGAIARTFSGEYAQYWLGSFCFWAPTIVWISYPHPATAVGWIVLSGYLSFYLPLFIGLCRSMNAVLRFPIWLASPICWVAVEWARNRVLGGFSFGGLSHALYDVPNLIQIAEPLGEYGVNATIALVGALVGTAFVRRLNDAPSVGGRSSVRLISLAAIALICTILYGNSRIAYYNAVELDVRNYNRPAMKIALLQDSTQYRFPPPKGLNKEVSDKYRALALEASQTEGGYDLIVWPEGCYFGYFFDTQGDYNDLIDKFDSVRKVNDGPALTMEQIAQKYPRYAELESSKLSDTQYALTYVRDRMLSQRQAMARTTARLGTTALLGVASAVFDETGEPTTYNSAVLVPYLGNKEQVAATPEADFLQAPTYSLMSESGSEFRRYCKTHLVLFGEYIPFLKYLPDSWDIKAVCAECVLGRGPGPAAFRVSPRDSDARFVLAPNICFESSIPHLIKAQIRECKTVDADPDILVNISHDGWFRCGIETDMHLATHVFRAIENRRSVVTATHGGFSAWIDPCGRIREKGERGKTQVVEATIPSIKVKRQGLYGGVDLGETWSLCCAILAAAAWLVFGVLRLFNRGKAKNGATLATEQANASEIAPAPENAESASAANTEPQAPQESPDTAHSDVQ